MSRSRTPPSQRSISHAAALLSPVVKWHASCFFRLCRENYRNSFHRSLNLLTNYIAPKFQSFPINFDFFSMCLWHAAARYLANAPSRTPAHYCRYQKTRFILQSNISSSCRNSFVQPSFCFCSTYFVVNVCIHSVDSRCSSIVIYLVVS